MNNLLKKFFVATVIVCCSHSYAIYFENSFSAEVKFKNGGSSGEIVLSHPKIKGSEVASGRATAHTFFNVNALSRNRIQALSYICMNSRMILFTDKNQKLTEAMSIRTTFSSGAAARNVFPYAFSWLASLSGMNSSEPSRLACQKDFLDSVSSYRLETLNNVQIDEYQIKQKKTFFSKRVKTIITW